MADVVKTIYEVDATQAFATADKLEARYQKLDSGGGAGGASKIVTTNLKEIEQQAYKLQNILKSTIQSSKVSEVPIWKTWETGARRAVAQVNGLTRELRTLQLLSNNTDDPENLKQIQKRAKEVAAEIDRLTIKVDRVAKGRVGATDRLVGGLDTPAGRAHAAKGFLGSGIGKQTLNKILPPEAEHLAELLELGHTFGVSGGGLAAAGGVGAAGLAIVAVTEKMKEDAKKVLEEETKRQEVLNKEAETLKEQISSYRSLGAIVTKNVSVTAVALQQIQQANIKAGFGFGSGGTKTLEQLVAPARASRDFEERFERAKNNASDLQAILEDIQQGRLDQSLTGKTDELATRTVLAMDELKRRRTGFTREEIEENKRADEARAEREKARLADVNTAITKAKELGKEFRNIFDDLTKRKNESNPYVSFLIDSEQATKKLREQTKGLSEELRKQFEAMEKGVQQTKLFDLRLNTQFQALDLRETANRFRDTSKEDNARLQTDLEAAISRLDQQESEGLFRSGKVREALVRRLESSREEPRTVEERFQRQLDILQRAGASTEEEKRVVDRRVLALGSQLTPEQLNAQQREAIASAAEREAVRTETAEKEANKIRADQLRTQQAIEASMDKLLDLASREGTAGLNKQLLAITVKDETEAGIDAKKATSAKSSDVADFYFSGFDTVGGSNR